MTTPSLSCIVLAAGAGTRMRSARPKPLHVLCGRAMVLHILEAVAQAPMERAVVVVGHGAEQVSKLVADEGPPGLAIDFVEQRVRRGTGDAVMAALNELPDDDLDDEGDASLVVVPGDAPLVRPATLAALVETHHSRGAAATLLSTRLADPTGYGRVVRDREGAVRRIVEEVEAGPDERAIDEVATSIYCFRRSLLAPALRRVSPDNRKGEYYLTDVIEVLAGAGHPVGALVLDEAAEVMGVNDRSQLAVAEAELRRRINQRWMERGVTMVDPERTYLDSRVVLASDVTLLPGTMLAGHTAVGEGARIGPDCHLVDCSVGAGAVVVHAVATDAEIGDGASVGPFAALGAGATIAARAATGAFYTAP